MMKTKQYFSSALLVLALAGVLCGCSKESNSIDSAEPKGEASPINFTAQLAGETKATTPLPQDTKVLVITAQREYSSSAHPLTGSGMIDRQYVVGETGMTVPSDYTYTGLSLFKGFYDFYAVAENKAEGQLLNCRGNMMNGGIQIYVESGKDYVGGFAMGQEVMASTTKDVVFTLDHLSTKINLALEKDATIAEMTVSEVTITPTKSTLQSMPNNSSVGALKVTAASMDIDHANVEVISTPVVMESIASVTNSFSYILLPSSKDGTLTFKITANITPVGSNTSETRHYTLAHPISDAAPLLGKKLYNMKATIGLHEATFDGAAPTVEDWIGEPNKTLTPDEQ